MDNQPWDKAKLQEWKKFWDSEMGKIALEKMNAIKEQMINNSMAQADADTIAAFVGRAAGIELILQDIQAGIDSLEKMGEEDKKKK